MTGIATAPLSWGQRQMLRAMGIDPHPAHFHMTDELEMRGSLDVDRLADTLADTFAHHPSLHVRIVGTVGDEMTQCFDGARRIPCPIHDLRALDRDAADAALADLREAIHRAPFVLDGGQLFRYALVRVADDACVLLLAVHHLVADDWSMRILQQELAGRLLGEVPSASATAMDEPAYFAFARDEQAWLASVASEPARRYWTRRLDTLSGQLPLPFDRQRVASTHHARGVLRRSVSREVSTALRQHARDGHATLFAVLLAAYDVLLWRLSHGRRIPVATLVANRESAEFDGTVGLFFNTLVLVADIEPERSFRGLAASTARQLREAMSHQRVPFQALVDRHLPVRDPLRAPFTQALFALLGTPGGSLRLGDVELAQKGGIDTGSIYDLSLTAFEKPDALDIVFAYDASMFDAATIGAWCDVYMNVLAQVASDVESPLRTLGFEGLAASGEPFDAWGCPVPVGFVGATEQGDGFARRHADGSVQRLDTSVCSQPDIEGVLGAFPGVTRAVVTVDEAHGVVAHLVHRRDGLDLPALRRQLYAALPMDRVPGQFRSVPWIAEYVSGLVDGSELWCLGRPTEASSRRLPASEHEAAVLSLWREAIHTGDLGPDDNFFASGGNSLSAAWIVVEAQRRFQASVSVRDVFEAGTAAAFASRLDAPSTPARPWYVDAREAAVRWEHREADGSLSHPTSEAQARMWILDKLVGGSDRYVLKTSHRIRGPLDRERLRAALRALTTRHEQLRAVFHEVDGDIRQRILAPDAISLAECADDARGQATIRLTLDTPFDLQNGPNMRALLVTTGSGQDHYIHVAIHHIVTDGWSMNIMMDDWLRLYDGGRALPPLPVEYREYCSWRHSAGVLDAIASDLDYWRGQLAQANAETPLPERKALRDSRPASGHQAFQMDAALCRRLADICAAHGTSLHTIMLAAFAVVLWRYTGQSDLSIGEPIANRDHDGLDRVVGLFVNTVVLRLRFGPATGLGALMDTTRDTVLDALAHANAPFDEVVQALKASRYRDGSPLFDTLFSFNEFPAVRPLGGGLQLEDVPQVSRDARTRLACIVTMAHGVAHGDLEFRADTLDPTLVASLAHDYVRLLDQWSQRPEAMVHELAVSHGRVDRPPPPPGFDPARFDDVFSVVRRQAASTPDRPALRDGDRTYTYAEVMEATRRGAAYLRGRRSIDGMRVGVACERSARLTLCVLAVLRAGAAYSPLYLDGDADNWQEHVRVAQLDLVVIDRPSAAVKLGDTAWTMLDDVFADDDPCDDPGLVAIHPQAPAVVFRTSGSTGRPKYVVVPHAGIVQLLTWAGVAYDAGDYTNASFATAIGFDVSLFELLAPWTLGGSATMMANLLDLDAEVPLTTLSSTPTQVRGVLDERPFPASIRVLNMAGEALPQTLVERVFAETAVERIVNLYGPTEASIYSSFHVMERGADTVVRIGRPQPHVDLYVVDETLTETPAGVAGEICIGGVGLAHGYAGSPALTAELFVPDPVAAEAGARMYRTRDIGRVAADGALDYLGRIDSVQKLRGVWVNFNELAEDVRRCAPIQDAVVCLVPGIDAEDAPVMAFCVVHAGVAFDEAALRREFRERVASTRPPAYAHIVSRFVAVDALPLNANGKVDVRAVQAMAPREVTSVARPADAPSGRMASVLWHIWKNVLKIEGVSAEDDFFAIGGHSLMALRVLSELKQATGITMALGTIFEFPVFADFVTEAERLAERRDTDDSETAGSIEPAMPASSIERADRSGRLPVSFAQQRMWFMSQMEGGSEAYHIAFGLRLDGRVDQPAMRRALDTIMARHESLRTTFHFVDGVLEQRIAPAQTSHFPLTAYDLRETPDWKAEVVRLSALTVLEPFDFATGPLVRACLMQVSEDRHVLRITMHHMVSDGWSMGVMRREFGALYTAFRAGLPDPLEALPIQHVDYVVWQRQWMDSEVMRRQAAYWRNNLAGAPVTLDLPTDRPRPTHPRYTGNVVHFAIDEDLSAGLTLLGRRHGATPYMTLLAGWAILLSRLSGQDDVLIGSPVANRIREETEGLIGFFANNLVLRLRLQGAPTVAELIGQARKQALSAQSNQDIPFEQVVELTQPLRSLSHSPLFQVMFAWQNMPRGKESDLSGLRTGRLRSRTPRVSSRFDMTLSLFDQHGRIVGGAEYSTALFDGETVSRYLDYYRHILRAMVAGENLPVDRLAMLGDDERERLVRTWNRTATTFPGDECLHHPFERQAARAPQAIALNDGDATLTYGQLDRAAQGVADRLVAIGVGPGSRVGICARRGFAPVVAMLGVLKAGGAYVPLDPTYPPDRLAFVLDDCAPAAVLVDDATRETIGAMPLAVPCLAIDGGTDSLADADARPRRQASPQDLAYVIYTSGSTGRPKGVMIEHRSVLNTLHDINARYGIGADDRVLALSSMAFDLSVYDIFGMLAAGGSVVLPPPETVPEPERWLGIVTDKRITVWNTVPALMQLLVDVAESTGAVLDHVRVVMLSGDWVPAALIGRVRALMPHAAVYSLGGATEGSIWSIAHHASDLRGAMVPYGRPLANQHMYVLDGVGEPCPPGVVGELHIGGAGVARGYFGRPGLTATRFIPDHLSGLHGATLYRTGDLGRWLSDGTIEFLGRNDSQVKIRGFRIELGEIEARLREHPDLRDVAVVVRDDHGAGPRLVAYVVGHEAVALPSTIDMHALVARTLPDYMLPAAYVPLPALPLSPNGKVARDQLPSPDDDDMARSYREQPLPGIETILAGIWSELLQTPQVTRMDNFFRLGGHSLLVMRVVVAVRQRLGVEMRMSDLFAHPVLSDLAQLLSASSAASLPPIAPMEHGERIPLSFAQRRLWFLCQVPEISRAYHISMGLTLEGPLDKDALRWALDRIVARHDVLRSTFGFDEGEPYQRIQPEDEASFALSEHDLSGHAEWRDELTRLVREDARAPFVLDVGPLVRGRLVRLAADRHILRLTVHHIVTDAWSMGILGRDLSVLYRAGLRGRIDSLARPPIRYADFAQWQATWIEGDVLQAQAAYWRRQLTGIPTLLQLPTDSPRPPVQRFSGSVVDIELDKGLTSRLRELAARHGVTLHMALLAAWAAVLGRLSGQDDIVIGVPVSNRRQAETEDVIGFFLNTLALRVSLAGHPRVQDLLGHVKSVSVDALQNQDIPFEQVVELIRPERSLAHSPVFQVMFQWQTRNEGYFDLDGLSISRSRGSHNQRTVKFDMTLSLYELDDRIVGGVEYASSLFSQATVERYAGYLQTLLQDMTQDPTRPVAWLAMLSTDESTRLVDETVLPDDDGRTCIHHMVEAAVRATPDAIALSFGDERLGYRELDALADRVASGLQALGVGRGDRVALCMDRTPSLVACLLGVLKTGAAYVPMDPAYPVERLLYILDDAAPAVVVATDAARRLLDAGGDAGIAIVAPEALLATESGTPVDGGAGPDDLAYLIYTSGSTGRPKGVAIEHRQAVNFLAWGSTAFSREELRGTLFATSLNFDLAVFECLLPLTLGREVRMVRNVLDLRADDTTTTLVNTVPSAMRALLDNDRIGPSIATVNLAGEALPHELVKRIFASTQVESVCNLYGPSETTTYSTWQRMHRQGSTRPDIGRPIAHTRIYILDAHGQLVPQGVIGQIHIAGRGVARGYWRRAGLSAERFVPDPFAATPGERMYRTGDLGHWTAEGTLEFHGRNDQQVKVRGFRIEPGEIEACLGEDAGVARAVVIARDQGAGNVQLVAYLVPSGEAQDTARLRDRVASRLPEYMVPVHYVWLERLPLTPTGKLDRAALPPPPAASVESTSSEPPEGSVETTIAGIWCELLGLRVVGRDDNFFALGGHSLLAMRLIGAMNRHGWPLGPLDIFMTPTVRGLARQVAVPVPVAPAGIVHVRRTNVEPPLFFVHDGTDNLQYLYMLEPQLPPSLPVVGLPAVPRDAPPLTTIEAMATRLVDLMVDAFPHGPYRIAGWSIGGILAYEAAHQLRRQGREVAFVGLFDTAYLRGTRLFSRIDEREAELVVDDKVYLLQLIRSRLALQNDYERFSQALATVQAGMEGMTLHAFVDRCDAAGILPPDFSAQGADALHHTFERQRLYIRAQLAYHAPRLEMPIHLFQARIRASQTPMLGWSSVMAPEDIRTVEVPGDHFSMMSGSNAAITGRELAIALAVVRQPQRHDTDREGAVP